MTIVALSIAGMVLGIFGLVSMADGFLNILSWSPFNAKYETTFQWFVWSIIVSSSLICLMWSLPKVFQFVNYGFILS